MAAPTESMEKINKKVNKPKKMAEMDVDEFMKTGLCSSSDESDDSLQTSKPLKKKDIKANSQLKKTTAKLPEKTSNKKPKVKTLDRLKDQDPEFYKFLQSEDKELLEGFDSGEDVGDDDDDAVKEEDNDDVSSDEDEALRKFEEDILAQSDDDRDSDEDQYHKPPSKLEVASDESDDDGGEDGDDETGKSGVSRNEISPGSKLVTLKMIKQWNDSLQKQPTVAVLRQVIQAFKAAVRSTSKSDEVTIYHVEGGVVFNGIVRLCLLEIVPALQTILNLPNLQSVTEVPSLSKGKNWTKLKASVKSYIIDLLKLVSSISEPVMINVILKHVHKMVPLCSVFIRLSKKLVKKCTEIWSTGEETSRVLAFLSINKTIGLLQEQLLESSIKQMYLAFVKNCKFTSPTTLPLINFMQRSLVEIFLKDLVLAYQYAFIYIRQLAIHLRNAITVKKKETVQAVYNWQFIHCIGLWVKLLGTSYPSDVLQPLIYPLTQTIIGTTKLQPTSKFYPLRFHCVRALTLLSDMTNTYIPVLPFLLESDKFSRKRKAPTPRSAPVSKKQLFEVSEALLSLQDVCPPENHGSSIISASPMLEHSMADITNTPNGTSSYRESDTFSKGTQTTFACSDLVAGKINQIINKNNASLNSKVSSGKPVPKFGYKKLSKNGKLFKFYSGITVAQFNHLYNCFGDTVNNLIYWKGNKTRKSVSTKIRKSITRKITPKNQLLLTLIKLRQAFPNKDLAYRFDTSISSVSEIVNTWIQFLFKQTACIRQRMFPSRELIREHLPASFKSFKNVRVIIDCFEIFVQSSRDFAEQGNLYSSYKHHSTLKCLAGIAPTGGITFLSDVYEGSISDKDIFIKSGLLELLNPGDLVIADRGFLIKEVLQSRKVELNIPPFLCGREKLTPQEEILTKRIARVRIHVERVIERMKKFKIIGSRLALNLKPVASQIVHIIGLLVNYQEPLVK